LGHGSKEHGKHTERPTDRELEAMHELELGLEWVHRAHGHLVVFHHGTGYGVDHLARAEELLRECGHEMLADTLRDEHLPRGVIDGDRWSSDVLASFQAGLLAAVLAFEERAREEVTDGGRHAMERRQERRWTERSRDH
jgi:hypothetical protein